LSSASAASRIAARLRRASARRRGVPERIISYTLSKI
jgi:hypothetical protein